MSHNPYFNRWFSAIRIQPLQKNDVRGVTILILIDGFLQSYNKISMCLILICHNPYFNRWFSAILTVDCFINELLKSQSLF